MMKMFVPLEEPTNAVEPLLDVAADECASPPAASELSDWTQNDFDLDTTLAGKLGFGLGGLSVNARQRLLIREFARSSICRAADGTRYRYGTAVRLVVKVSSISASAHLSIPVVAAETQVGRMEASSSLRVVGYVGKNLAGLLPPFRTFNVDAYAELSTQMNEVKKLIGEDEENVRPTKLGVEIDVEEEADVTGALGLLWGLSQIQRRHSCTEAKQHFPDQGSLSALRAIEKAYTLVPSSHGCTDRRPSEVHREAAKEMLHGLELK